MREFKRLPEVKELFDGKTNLLARTCGTTNNWSAFNPSITLTPELGYVVLLRSANNYMQDHRLERRTAFGKEMDSPDSYEDPNEWEMWGTYTEAWEKQLSFRNKMFLASFDPKKLTIGKTYEVDSSKIDKEVAPNKIKRGLEDGRIYHDGNSLRISSSALEKFIGPYARIINVRLDTPADKLDKSYISEFKVFDSPKEEIAIEKNWMPLEKGQLQPNERPSWDYIYDTTSTYTIATNSLEKVSDYELPLRGGSQLIPLPDGNYLSIMHELMSHETMRFADYKKSPLLRRRYAHRFVLFNSRGQLVKVTDRFSFLNKSIEFASGLTFNEDRLVVTFGALDCYAYVSSLSYDAVLSALREPLIDPVSPILPN